jgi:hypothetical protein
MASASYTVAEPALGGDRSNRPTRAVRGRACAQIALTERRPGLDGVGAPDLSFHTRYGSPGDGAEPLEIEAICVCCSWYLSKTFSRRHGPLR